MHPRHSRDTWTPARPKLTSSMTTSPNVVSTPTWPARAILVESAAGAPGESRGRHILCGGPSRQLPCSRDPGGGPTMRLADVRIIISGGRTVVDKDEFKKRLGEFFAEKNVQPIRKLEPDMVMICTRGAEF